MTGGGYDGERGGVRVPDGPLLEVVCAHARDVLRATEGGADRVLLATSPEVGGLTPSPREVSAAARETDLPMRVLLRPREDDLAPEDLASVVGAAQDAISLGASGLALGFLDDQLAIDREATRTVLEAVAGTAEARVPWTFHRGFDACLSADHAWGAVVALGVDSGLDAVATGGSARGFAIGGEELMARAAGDAEVARLAQAAGGVSTESVPWLVRSGVVQVQLGVEVRADGSWERSHVDPSRVRAWRLLVDDAAYRAAGVPVE